MSDASATLEHMRDFVARDSEDGLSRLGATTSGMIAESLRNLGLSADDAAEAAGSWESFRSNDEWRGLLASLLAHLERLRGWPDEPVAVWEDVDDLGASGRLFYLFVGALAAPGTARYLRREGFPADVVAASLGTLARHARVHRQKTGTLGVDAGWWTLLVLRGDLVNVGALQFHRYRLGAGVLSPQPWYSEQEADALGEGFGVGAGAIGLHIPDGTDLSAPRVDASLARARALLDRCWPVRGRRLVTCQTWMFDDRLRAGLGAGSNLVRFASRFTMVPGSREGDEDVREFVLSRRRGSPSLLQNLVRDALCDGGHWASRVGWIAWDVEG